MIEKGEYFKRLIPDVDMKNFTNHMIDPNAVCQDCKGQVDCIGIAECYPDDQYFVIEYVIRKPKSGEIVGMVNS